MMTADPSAPRGFRLPVDLATHPLASGEQMSPHFTWTYEGDAKEKFGFPGTIFTLTATDIRGSEVRGTFVLH
jgi:hypothetical protein